VTAPGWADTSGGQVSITQTIEDATHKLLPTLLTVGGIGIGVSAGMLALGAGWSFFRGMVKGDDGSNWEADGEIVDSWSGDGPDDFFAHGYDPITGEDY